MISVLNFCKKKYQAPFNKFKSVYETRKVIIYRKPSFKFSNKYFLNSIKFY